METYIAVQHGAGGHRENDTLWGPFTTKAEAQQYAADHGCDEVWTVNSV